MKNALIFSVALFFAGLVPVCEAGTVGNPATMVSPNQQHVFYRGTDGAIHHVWWDQTANHPSCDNWTQASGAGPAAGDPATMAWPGQQHVFYLGTDNAIHHIWWDQNTNQFIHDNWTTKVFPNPAATDLAAGNPATMVWPNQQHVFYRGMDNAIHHIWWDQNTNQFIHDNWTTKVFPNPAATDLAAGNPATMVWPNQQHVFYRGMDNAIHHIWWDQNTNQFIHDNWTDRTQASGAVPAAGDPATMVWPNQQHVFYRGTDNNIHHIWWDQNTNQFMHDNWTTQALGATPAAGDPATMVWPNQQHVFYGGNDGAIHHIWWDQTANHPPFHDYWTPIGTGTIPGGSGGLAAVTYTVDPVTDFAIPQLADIDVLKVSDKEYYVTGTGVSGPDNPPNTINIYRSTDLHTFTKVIQYDPSGAPANPRLCSVWAPTIAIEPNTNTFVITFSAAPHPKQDPNYTNCQLPDDNKNILMYRVRGLLTSLGSPELFSYGSVISGNDESMSTMKIDPSDRNGRLFYVWFHNGNNIASVNKTPPYDIIAHTMASDWNEGINEGPGIFSRNGIFYLTFSVYPWTAAYHEVYIMGQAISQLVRKPPMNPALPFTQAVMVPGCTGGDCCILENNGHGTVVDHNGQYYFIYHKHFPATNGQMDDRSMYVTPIYFHDDGTIANMTTTKLSWNRPAEGYLYSLDAMTKATGEWIGPCMSAAYIANNSQIIGNNSQIQYASVCPGPDNRNRLVRKQEIVTFRLNYSKDGQWTTGHADHVDIANDATKDELTFPQLNPIPILRSDRRALRIHHHAHHAAP